MREIEMQKNESRERKIPKAETCNPLFLFGGTSRKQKSRLEKKQKSQEGVVNGPKRKWRRCIKEKLLMKYVKYCWEIPGLETIGQVAGTNFFYEGS